MAISHENGTVILHNAKPLLEIAHYYTVAELEYIEETVNNIEESVKKFISKIEKSRL